MRTFGPIAGIFAVETAVVALLANAWSKSISTSTCWPSCQLAFAQTSHVFLQQRVQLHL